MTELTGFRKWFTDNLSESASDIANHGADGGFPYITYTMDCVAIFQAHAEEIWGWAVEEAEECDYDSVAGMLGSFKRKDMMGDWWQFQNLLLWYACEKVAREIEYAREQSAEDGEGEP